MPDEIKPVEKPVTAEAPATESVNNAASAKKKSSTLKIVLIVVGVLVGLTVLGTIASIVFLGALFNSATDGVDVNDGSVTIQTENGEVKTNVGEGTKLADGFPSDVPIFSPSTLMASSKAENSSFSAVAKTASSVGDVTNFYKTQMASQGWTTQLDSSSGDGTLLTFAKDDRTASVVVTTSTEESSNEKTGFVVSVTNQSY